MRRLRTVVPVLVLSAVLATFIGVSAAIEGEDPTMGDVSTTVPEPDCGPDLPADTALPATDASEAEPCTEDTDATLPTGDPDADPDADADEGEAGVDDGSEPEAAPEEAPANHGAAVSEAARSCPPGPEHGPCVSAVARSDAGKPAHADADDDPAYDDVAEGDDVESAPPRPGGPDHGKAGGGRGHGRP